MTSPSPQTTPTMPPPPPPTFSQTLNLSTNPHHTALNRLILRLLPLALPPHTNTPLLYCRGMSSILRIYTTFESGLNTISSTPPSARSRLQQAISTLYIPALERAPRLKSDLHALLCDSAVTEKEDLMGFEVEERGSREWEKGPRLVAFLDRIERVSAEKPHLLLAYMHTFYLALFSGGRYIRGQSLKSGYPQFENEEALSFWFFNWEGEGGEDGLKAEFKARFEVAAASLLETEREKILRECELIMEGLQGVVEEIEESVGGEGRLGLKGKTAELGGMRWVGLDVWWIMVLKHLLPMGLAELILGGLGWWRWGEILDFAEA